MGVTHPAIRLRRRIQLDNRSINQFNARAVSDDSEAIRLSFYSADGAACGLELDPAHAVRLAGRLIEAASVRLLRLQ